MHSNANRIAANPIRLDKGYWFILWNSYVASLLVRLLLSPYLALACHWSRLAKWVVSFDLRLAPLPPAASHNTNRKQRYCQAVINKHDPIDSKACPQEKWLELNTNKWFSQSALSPGKLIIRLVLFAVCADSPLLHWGHLGCVTNWHRMA